MPTTKGTSTQTETVPDKGKLLSQSQPDKHIAKLQTQYPDLYQATKNTSNTIQTLINEIFPARPAPVFEWRFVITSPSGGTDVLDHHYRVVTPIDPEGVWNYAGILLTRTIISDKTPGTSVSIDILRQTIGTTTWASLYKATFNPQLASGKVYSTASQFAINSLYETDVLRVDILSSGSSTAVGVEIVLSGVYVMEASQ